MNRCLIILFSIQAILFQSCKNDDSATPNPYAAKILSQLNPTDTFLFDFPVENGKLDTAILENLSWQEKWLKLPSLQKGFDSIQIRIWYGCFLGGSRLVTLMQDGKSWKAEISNLTFHVGGEGQGGYWDSLTRTVHSKTPRSGWVKFIDTLLNLEILTLPNDYDIPKFELKSAMDGCWTGFEISTENTYRFYKYSNPDFYHYWQAKNVVRILKLLGLEFDITEWPEGKQKKSEKEDQGNEKIIIRELDLDSFDKVQKKNK